MNEWDYEGCTTQSMALDWHLPRKTMKHMGFYLGILDSFLAALSSLSCGLKKFE